MPISYRQVGRSTALKQVGNVRQQPRRRELGVQPGEPDRAANALNKVWSDDGEGILRTEVHDGPKEVVEAQARVVGGRGAHERCTLQPIAPAEGLASPVLWRRHGTVPRH